VKPGKFLGLPLALALLVVASGAGARGQNPPPVVTAQTYLASSAAHAGTTVRAAVVAQVEPGYHINAHHPTFDYLIPTELTLEAAAHLSVRKTVYPKGQPVSFTFSDSPLSVYEGTVRVGMLVDVARGTPAGDYALEGKLHYQACNDHACLAPASAPVAIKVKVVSRRVAVKPLNQEIFKGLELE
jgi:thioredoxin:protein disulfide reductase